MSGSGAPLRTSGTARTIPGKVVSRRIFVEDWNARYGSPYIVPDDDEGAIEARVVEDSGSFQFHNSNPIDPGDLRIAFVDGIRRGDVSLYQEDPDTGALARGYAASHACGAVFCAEASRPVVGGVRVSRLVIWGSGATGDLPAVAGGWTWAAESVASTEPDAPVRTLQTRMRQNEARLTEDLASAGWHVVVDGPLHYVRYSNLAVTGFVKTHARAYLAPDVHRTVRNLRAGQRTSIFVVNEHRPSEVYSSYLRLADPGPDGGPWYGVVRLEFPCSAGLEAVAAEADQMAGVLPRYASLPYTDPRAPQNLQPIGALERELRHRLGDPGLAVRAVRASVATLRHSHQGTVA